MQRFCFFNALMKADASLVGGPHGLEPPPPPERRIVETEEYSALFSVAFISVKFPSVPVFVSVRGIARVLHWKYHKR